MAHHRSKARGLFRPPIPPRSVLSEPRNEANYREGLFSSMGVEGGSGHGEADSMARPNTSEELPPDPPHNSNSIGPTPTHRCARECGRLTKGRREPHQARPQQGDSDASKVVSEDAPMPSTLWERPATNTFLGVPSISPIGARDQVGGERRN